MTKTFAIFANGKSTMPARSGHCRGYRIAGVDVSACAHMILLKLKMYQAYEILSISESCARWVCGNCAACSALDTVSRKSPLAATACGTCGSPAFMLATVTALQKK